MLILSLLKHEKLNEMTIKKINPLRHTTSSRKVNHPPKTVGELKKKYNHLPLHFLFGIQKEIDLQCPVIDEYLEKLNEVKTALEKIKRCQSLENAKIQAAVGLHSLGYLPDELDDVTRGNFEKLRKTAEDWKQLAIEAMNETKNPGKFLKF